MDNIGELLGAAGMYIDALAFSGDLSRATALVGRMREKWEQHCSENNTIPEATAHVGIADALGSLQIRVLLAYRSVVKRLSPDSTADQLRRVNWARVESIYSKGFTSAELRLLEWISPRLEAEKEIEGKIRRPNWYIQDLIMKAQMEAMVGNLNSIVEKGSECQGWSDRMVKAGRVWQSAAVLPGSSNI